MTNTKDIYVTITGCGHYQGTEMLRPGVKVKLVRDEDNEYDDEAIAVKSLTNVMLGYVANSVHTVARGTYSAGWMCAIVEDHVKAEVMFTLHGTVIARILEDVE